MRSGTHTAFSSVVVGVLATLAFAPYAFGDGDDFIPPPPGPVVSPVSITSNNSDSAIAVPGDVVTLSFKTDVVPNTTPSVTIGGHAASVVSGGESEPPYSWTASVTMASGDVEGIIEFSAAVQNVAGDATTLVTSTTDESLVTFQDIAPPLDTTPPVIDSHSDITTEATSGSGAVVAYTAPTVTDDVDASFLATCLPASGTTFGLGATTVTCNASDAALNAATPTTFLVNVVPVVPVADPVAGTYTSAQSVTLSASGSTNIHYTTDGSEPSCTSGSTFSSAITVDSSQTIKALSCYNSGDTFVASSVASFEYVINIPAPTPSGGGGGGGGGSGGSLFPVAPVLSGGQVLGASTSTSQGESGGSCSSDLLITTYMRLGQANDPVEVKKLQQFLNAEMGLALEVDGFFGLSTDAAVRAFQEKYASDVLAPWGITKPTGFVYLTTRHWINHIICASLDTPLPPLIPFSGQ